MIMSYFISRSTVTVPGSNVPTIKAEMKDILHYIPDKSFAAMFFHAKDQLENDILDLTT